MTQQTVSTSRAINIVPSDTFPILPGSTKIIHRLYVGSAGNVGVRTHIGDFVVFTGVPAGTYIDIHAQFVTVIGTTASNIVGFYD